jgi:hypothetical protein
MALGIGHRVRDPARRSGLDDRRVDAYADTVPMAAKVRDGDPDERRLPAQPGRRDIALAW